MEGDSEDNYKTVRAELAAHGAGLERLPELVALTKRDLLPADEVEKAGSPPGASGSLGDDVLGVLALLLEPGQGLD